MDDNPRLPHEVTDKPRKRGRPAKLTRETVTAIQAAVGTLPDIAAWYGVSLSTVARVRSEWYEYVPPEEDGSATSSKVDGRKTYVSLNEDERRRIAEDTRPLKEVADEWKVSRSYVAKLRVIHGTTFKRQRMVVEHVYQAIVTSEVSNAVLAERYGLPEVVVKAIRSGYHDKKEDES